MTDKRPENEAEAREPWVRPVIEELPPLTELTLQSGGPEGGSVDGGGNISGGGTGSTVF
jgi:hypothetical protein